MYGKFIIKTQAVLSWSKSIWAYGKILLISKPLKHLLIFLVYLYWSIWKILKQFKQISLEVLDC